MVVLIFGALLRVDGMVVSARRKISALLLEKALGLGRVGGTALAPVDVVLEHLVLVHRLAAAADAVLVELVVVLLVLGKVRLSQLRLRARREEACIARVSLKQLLH